MKQLLNALALCPLPASRNKNGCNFFRTAGISISDDFPNSSMNLSLETDRMCSIQYLKISTDCDVVSERPREPRYYPMRLHQ